MRLRYRIWLFVILILTPAATADEYQLRWSDMHRPVKHEAPAPGPVDLPRAPVTRKVTQPLQSNRVFSHNLRFRPSFQAEPEVEPEPAPEPEPEPEPAYVDPSSIRVVAYPYHNYYKDKTIPVASITIEELGANWRISLEENAIFLSAIEASMPNTDRSTFYRVSIEWEDGSTRIWEYWHDATGEMVVMIDQPFTVASY